jgi:predicted choloylglycine hydrolase
MSTPAQPPQGFVSHLEHVAEQIAADAVQYVHTHPQYPQMIQLLGDKALQALAAEVGFAL